METTVTESGKFERLLTLTLAETDLESAKDDAARRLAKQIKIKGFRPGKAPRVVVERTVGSDSLRAEAIDDALPGLVTAAIGDTDLDPVTTPRIEEVRDRDEGGVTVDVRITLWPKLESVPIYEGRRIEVEPPVVEHSDIQEQIDRFRSQFAELEDVERAAGDGDFVMINLSATKNGEPIEEASAEDLLYGIGSSAFLPGLDELLLGVNAGDIREGQSTLPEGFDDSGGEPVDIKVLVKGVRGRKLPEVTDGWVSDVSEFESVNELTQQLRTSMHLMQLSAARTSFQESLLEAIIDDIDLELPEPLVAAEMEARVHNMAHALEDQGIDFGNYLRITGQDQEAFTQDIRDRAVRNLMTQLVIDAVVADEHLVVEDADLDVAIADMAASSGQETAAFRSSIEASGQVVSLTGDILRSKALDRLIGGATAVDENGNEVDLTPPVVEQAAEGSTETRDDDGAEPEAAATVEPEADETSAESADLKDSDVGADNNTE